MTNFVRLRKWKLTALALFSFALSLDIAVKQSAADSARDAALRIVSDSPAVPGYISGVGLLAALLGTVCGVVSVVKGEPGLLAPLVILASFYVLHFLMMV